MPKDLREKIAQIVYTTWQEEGSITECSDKILALIREEVPTEKKFNIGDIGFSADSERSGWNAYRTELMKLLNP